MQLWRCLRSLCEAGVSGSAAGTCEEGLQYKSDAHYLRFSWQLQWWGSCRRSQCSPPVKSPLHQNGIAYCQFCLMEGSHHRAWRVTLTNPFLTSLVKGVCFGPFHGIYLRRWWAGLTGWKRILGNKSSLANITQCKSTIVYSQKTILRSYLN